MKLPTLLSVLLLITIHLKGQNVTQSVRGKVVDQDSQSPLIGATIIIVGSDPLIGSVTDVNGEFRLVDVPIGRVNILNNQTVVGEYYVHGTESIVQVTQLGILPTLSYRISF